MNKFSTSYISTRALTLCSFLMLLRTDFTCNLLVSSFHMRRNLLSQILVINLETKYTNYCKDYHNIDRRNPTSLSGNYSNIVILLLCNNSNDYYELAQYAMITIS